MSLSKVYVIFFLFCCSQTESEVDCLLRFLDPPRQYVIVHSDISGQHQYSEIVRTATITAQTTQWTTNAHRSRTHQTCKYHTTFCTSYETQNTPKLTHRYTSSQTQHATNRETESTIIEHGAWRYPIRTLGSPRKTEQQTYYPTRGATSTQPCPRSHGRIRHPQPQHVHGTEIKLPPPDFIHSTRYNTTQGTNKPHHQETTKRNNGTRTTCIHTHCH